MLLFPEINPLHTRNVFHFILFMLSLFLFIPWNSNNLIINLDVPWFTYKTQTDVNKGNYCSRENTMFCEHRSTFFSLLFFSSAREPTFFPPPKSLTTFKSSLEQLYIGSHRSDYKGNSVLVCYLIFFFILSLFVNVWVDASICLPWRITLLQFLSFLSCFACVFVITYPRKFRYTFIYIISCFWAACI